MIKSGVTEFIFGSKSEFDDLCYQIVSKLKEKYPNIIRIFLHLPSETGIITLEEKIRLENALCKQLHKNIDLAVFEKSILSKKSISANKNAYIARNYEMINMSDLCVFYYNKNYSLSNKENKTKSGTAYVFQYATRKKQGIINTYHL